MGPLEAITLVMSRDTEPRCRISRFGLLCGLPLATLLGACALEPFPVTPPPEVVESIGLDPLNEPQVRKRWEPRTSPVVLSYCYSNQFNAPQEVLEMARVDCEGGRLDLREQDAIWNGCAVLQPIRVSYICYPPTEDSFVPAPPK